MQPRWGVRGGKALREKNKIEFFPHSTFFKISFLFSYLRFSVATLFPFVSRFARDRIEGSSRNRFALNGIQSDFFGGIISGGNFIRIPKNNLRIGMIIGHGGKIGHIQLFNCNHINIKLYLFIYYH